MQLLEGTAVQLDGLVTRPEHNGRRGEVAGYDSSAGRYIVAVCTGGPPTKLKLRRDCAAKVNIRGARSYI